MGSSPENTTIRIFTPKIATPLKATKQGFLKNWPGLTENLIKKCIEKSGNTTMGHLNTRRQGLQSTRDKTPDTNLEDKSKTNAVFCTTVDPSTTKEGGIYSDLCGRFPTTSSRGNKYIYVMYVYDCNTIPTTAMNNISDKEIIQAFT